MEDPAFLTHPPRNSKRMYGGGSSSSSSAFLDADVIEIPPPPTWKSNRTKHNSTVRAEVIVVDDDDPEDVIILDEKIAPKNKGKKPMLNSIATNGSSSTHAFIIDDDFDGKDFTDISYDDDCVMLQAHFDKLEVPTGVEATVPWWPASGVNTSSSSSPFGMKAFSDVPGLNVDQFQLWSSQDLVAKQLAFESSYYESQFPSSGTPINTSDMFNPMAPWPLPQISKKKKGFKGNYHKLGTSFHSSTNPVPGHFGEYTPSSPFFSGVVPGFQDPSLHLDDNISAQISPPSTSGQGDASENPILTKLESFKKFDTLEDFTDHIYYTSNVSAKQSRSWGKKIADEWRMLEKDLPDTIFVRVCESRMDLLRAVIIGADGTPYHDGLFVFDVNFTGAYPNSPPHVKYHAHGLRINPNLYNCGKVCLSLLGTWSGHGAENWRPGKSNMLQVLVSIQGLILNAEPFYNEPGYANSMTTAHGRNSSMKYTENTFLLSLKTMLYTLRNPPKYFEDLVFGHFHKCAHDILAAAAAYLQGVEVGSFEKGKTLAAQKKRGKCSPFLKGSLPGYIKSLVEAFTKIGVKDCDKYLAPVDDGGNNSAGTSRVTRKRRKH